MLTLWYRNHTTLPYPLPITHPPQQSGRISSCHRNHTILPYPPSPLTLLVGVEVTGLDDLPALLVDHRHVQPAARLVQTWERNITLKILLQSSKIVFWFSFQRTLSVLNMINRSINKYISKALWTLFTLFNIFLKHPSPFRFTMLTSRASVHECLSSPFASQCFCCQIWITHPRKAVVVLSPRMVTLPHPSLFRFTIPIRFRVLSYFQFVPKL